MEYFLFKITILLLMGNLKTTLCLFLPPLNFLPPTPSVFLCLYFPLALNEAVSQKILVS
jgi:hypothetical protein